MIWKPPRFSEASTTINQAVTNLLMSTTNREAFTQGPIGISFIPLGKRWHSGGCFFLSPGDFGVILDGSPRVQWHCRATLNVFWLKMTVWKVMQTKEKTNRENSRSFKSWPIWDQLSISPKDHVGRSNGTVNEPVFAGVFFWVLKSSQVIEGVLILRVIHFHWIFENNQKVPQFLSRPSQLAPSKLLRRIP